MHLVQHVGARFQEHSTTAVAPPLSPDMEFPVFPSCSLPHKIDYGTMDAGAENIYSPENDHNFVGIHFNSRSCSLGSLSLQCKKQMSNRVSKSESSKWCPGK